MKGQNYFCFPVDSLVLERHGVSFGGGGGGGGERKDDKRMIKTSKNLCESNCSSKKKYIYIYIHIYKI